jgi:transposase-like protein
MRRAKLEGRRIGRPPLKVDVEGLIRDRERGLSISQLARQHGIAETSVRRLLRQAQDTPPKGSVQVSPQLAENVQPASAL